MFERLIHNIYRIFLVLVLFSICRLLFLIFNFEVFTPVDPVQILKSFFHGIRFDYAIIYYLNFPWLIFCLVPHVLWEKKWYQLFQKILFISVNSILIILNISDIEYFKFINSRSSFDVIQTMFLSKDVVFNIPAMALTYWYLVIFAAVFIYIFWRLFDIKIWIKKSLSFNWYYILFSYFIFHAISFSVARGFKTKPLRIVSAVEYVQPKYASLILNTPFTVVGTMSEDSDDKLQYFTNNDELKEYFNSNINCSSEEKRKDLNVVIIILESFNKEYIGKLSGYRSYTPFLDSLIEESLYASNGFANSRKSMDAIPSVLSSVPALAKQSIIASKYSVNRINSIPQFLKGKNYFTAFFHGGKNGTMGFDTYCKGIQIDKYYGLDEYPVKEHFDGNWGIPDEEFFDFTVNKINKFDQPFMAAIFSLSSHHPYKVPVKHKGEFSKGTLKIHESIQYTDFALSKFFNKAKTMQWYQKTLFVICADHTSLNEHKEYKNSIGFFKIPILFYHPGNDKLKGEIKSLVQQVDIFPSVIDYLNYDTSFIAFGKSVFGNDPKFAVNNLSNRYIYVNDTISLIYYGGKIKAVYEYKKDSLLQNDLLKNTDTFRYDFQIKQMKAYIQDYNNRLIDNKLTKIDEPSIGK